VRNGALAELFRRLPELDRDSARQGVTIEELVVAFAWFAGGEGLEDAEVDRIVALLLRAWEEWQVVRAGPVPSLPSAP